MSYERTENLQFHYPKHDHYLDGEETHKVYFDRARSMQRFGSLRRTSFIYKLAMKGLIYRLPPQHAMEYANHMDGIISAMKESYKEDWDIMACPYFDDDGDFGGYNLELIIRYPSFLITNSKDESHLIQELFVVITMKPVTGVDGVHFDFYTPRGTRAKMSYKEWHCGYKHSHLTSYSKFGQDSQFGLTDFCLGENEISDLKAQMRSEFSAELFQLYLLTLDAMVRWESIEGGPHYRIDSIQISSSVTPDEGQEALDAVSDYVLDYLTDLKGLDFFFDKDRYVVMDNWKLSDRVKDILSQYPDYKHQYIVAPKKINGMYMGYKIPTSTYSEQELTERFGDPDHYFIMLQGRKFNMKVENFLPGDIPDYETFIVHPKILKHVSKKLSQALYIKSIQVASAKRYNHIKHAEAYLRKNPVSM